MPQGKVEPIVFWKDYFFYPLGFQLVSELPSLVVQTATVSNAKVNEQLNENRNGHKLLLFP